MRVRLNHSEVAIDYNQQLIRLNGTVRRSLGYGSLFGFDYTEKVEINFAGLYRVIHMMITVEDEGVCFVIFEKPQMGDTFSNFIFVAFRC